MPEMVIHRNTSDYIYPETRNQLVFLLKTEKEKVMSVTLKYFSRTTPDVKKEEKMRFILRDDVMDIWECKVTFPKIARYQKYFFILEYADGRIVYFTSTGCMTKEPKNDYFEFLYANPNDCIDVPKWAKGCIYYQIFPERFCNGDTSNDPKEICEWGTAPTRENYMGGDIAGIRKKIPYLRELGIECIYLNPIFEGDFNHKYATTDYYKVDPIFGTNEEFAELVKECHEAEIRILLDGVFNHTGIHFAPFQDAFEKGKQSMYYDWFFFTADKPMITHHDYECVGAYKYMPKLNTANPEVREYVIDVMDYWIREYGIDGWRLDVADEVDGTLWNEARYRLKKKYPEMLLLGETWGDGGNLLDGKKMDAVMNYCFRDAVRDYYGLGVIDAEEFGIRINRMLGANRRITNKVQYNLLDSHDTERFLFYCNESKDRMRLAVAFQMLFEGSPAIYYGDEVGITGENDPDCRKCMVWDDKADKGMFKYYQSLIALRKRYTSLRLGDYRLLYTLAFEDLVVFSRSYGDENITVIIHGKADEDTAPKGIIPDGIVYKLDKDGDLTEKDKVPTVLEPESVYVIVQRRKQK